MLHGEVNFPPKKPDTRPYVTPIIKSIKVATMAIKREIRIPTITRFAKLRPRLSVPNRLLELIDQSTHH